VIRWADEKLLQFLDTFLCLKDGDISNGEKIADRMRFAA
jgi:hypothetical protein